MSLPVDSGEKDTPPEAGFGAASSPGAFRSRAWVAQRGGLGLVNFFPTMRGETDYY